MLAYYCFLSDRSCEHTFGWLYMFMWQQLLYVERLFWFSSVNVRLAFMRLSLLDAHHDMSVCAEMLYRIHEDINSLKLGRLSRAWDFNLIVQGSNSYTVRIVSFYFAVSTTAQTRTCMKLDLTSMVSQHILCIKNFFEWALKCVTWLSMIMRCAVRG